MADLPISFDEGEEFFAWLKALQLSDAQLVAYRSLMRVIPALVDEQARSSSANATAFLLRSLQATLATGCLIGQPSSDIRVRLAYLGEIFEEELDYRIQGNPAKDAAEYFLLTSSYRRLVALTYLIRSVTGADDSVAYAANVTSGVIFGDGTDGQEGDSRIMWSAISSDCERVQGQSLHIRTGLWPAPSPTRSSWDRARKRLADIPGGDFWIDWYQRALDGRPQNWPLLRDVALIDDDLWKQGGEALDRRINEIRGQYATSATPNGETIEPQPDTALLQLVPDTELSDDIGAYARRKIAGAVDLFDDAFSNQYSALSPDLAMLRRAVADSGHLPVELFDTCVSATQRLAIRIDIGDCPEVEKDPLIADYRDRLRQAAADILANDPKTQDVLESRNRIEGNEALLEGRETIIAAVEEVEPIITGHLAEALPEDADIATAPDAPVAERRVSSYRLASRMLRIGKWVAAGVGVVGGTIIGTQKVLEAIPAIQASPIFQKAIGYILRYLGM